MRDTVDMFGEPERGRFGEPSGVKLCDLTLVFHHDTRGAILVSADGDETAAVWLPKSESQMEATGKQVAGHKRNGQAVQLPQVLVTCPHWLAEERGLA